MSRSTILFEFFLASVTGQWPEQEGAGGRLSGSCNRAPDINVTPSVRHNFLHFDTDPAARLCLELEMLVAGWVSQLSGGLLLGAPVYFLIFFNICFRSFVGVPGYNISLYAMSPFVPVYSWAFKRCSW